MWGGIYGDEISKIDLEYFLPSAQLHDVGKLAISDLLLNKQTKLTPEEFNIMKTHVTAGVEVIQKAMNELDAHAFLQHALLIVSAHHEKWDGSGYPSGLRGLDIPIEGRLMAIADVYDALITERPYKKAFTHEEACFIIKKNSGSHFDPALTDVFKGVEGEFKKIAKI
jgi:putative two-component system response regulator